MNVASPDRVRFGIFEFDCRNRLLYRDGVELALPPRAVGVLACLLTRGGQVVSKQDLLDEVWKDANVTETSLAEAVSLLRQTLADDSQRPTFIQTLSRRGYRFVHPLTPANGPVVAGALSGLHEANLREADRRDGELRGDGVPGADLRSAARPRVDPPGTDSSALDRSRPDSSNTVSSNTDLSSTDLSSTDLSNTVPSGVDRQRAERSRAALREATPRDAGRVGAAVAADADERVWPAWLPWVLLAGVSAALLVVLVTTAREPSRTVRPVARFTLNLPADLTLATGAPAIALSSDGRRLAFVAARTGGPPRVFIRDLDQLEPAALSDTDDAAAPFFSPDGRWIGFFARGHLRKTPVGGGPVQTLCLAPHPFGATWTPDGSIIFASSWTGGLQRVSDDGGEPVVLTMPDAAIGEMRHAWPDLLPDGRGVLFAGLSGSDAPETARVAVLSLERRAIHPLFEAATFPRFVSTGHLLFTRGDAVFAAPFDPAALDVLGPAAPVLDAVRSSGAQGAAQLAVTRAGNLVAATADGADAPDVLRWVDALAVARAATPAGAGPARERAGPEAATGGAAAAADAGAGAGAGAGAEVETIRSAGRADAAAGTTIRETLAWPFPARLLRALAVSADGARVAASLGDGHRTDVWVGDLPNGVATRLTSTGQNVMPHWTPDGRVIFSARRDEAFNLFAKSPDDDAAATRLTTARSNQFVSSATSPLGAIFVESHPRTGLDLWLLPWTGGAPRPLARTARDETAGALSPDGRLLAYQISDGGTWRIVIRTADRAEEEPIALAEGDGTLTAWSPDGRALLFIRNGRLLRLTLVDAEPEAGRAAGLRAAGPAMLVSDAAREPRGYALTSDGRALVAARRGVEPRQRLDVVLEWARELSLKVPILPPAMRPVR